MFWGVTIESGKRYSQTVAESYHLSMACLEPLPNGTKPSSKEVSVMIEHGQAEYVLCVLEYGRVMQVNLDMIFDSGEVVTYFLLGEGIVHLTGYALPETDDDESFMKSNSVSASNVDEMEEEEDDEDWTPSKEKRNSESSDESEESEDEVINTDSEPDLVSPKREDEVEIVQNQLSETNEDEETGDDQEKRKKIVVKGNKAKKRKVSDSSPAENGVMSDVRSKKQPRIEVNHVNNEDSDNDNLSAEGQYEDECTDGSDEDDSSVDYSTEEQRISSVGRTPMPKKKINSTTSLGESPDLPHRQKNSEQKQKKTKLKVQDVSFTNKGSIPANPKNGRKLQGNIQIEDLRIGSGPFARNGKFVFVHYLGKLTNGKVFEKCEAPKKPLSFRMGRGEVIKGLDIGVEGMQVGGKRKITVPQNMGYGSKKVECIPPNSTLIFTVELEAVK